MIDFDALVLAPCMDTFAIAVKVTPTVSRPGAASFVTRGVFSSQPIDVATQDGGIVSDQQTTLGIRGGESPEEIGIGDLVEITDARHPSFGRKFFVRDNDSDGQGGEILTLGTR